MDGTIEMRAHILDLVDADTAPGRMSPQEALQYLEELAADVEARITALKEENGLD